MNLPMVVYLIGRLLTAEGLMLIIPAVVSAIYGEQALRPFYERFGFHTMLCGQREMRPGRD